MSRHCGARPNAAGFLNDLGRPVGRVADGKRQGVLKQVLGGVFEQHIRRRVDGHSHGVGAGLDTIGDSTR